MDARVLLRAALLVIVALIGYIAYLQYTWYPGRDTSISIRRAIALADEVNAGISKDDLIKEATSDGEVDVEKLGRLLRPSAIRAGKLKRLEEELRWLSEGQEPPRQSPSANQRRTGGERSKPVASEPDPPPRALEIRTPEVRTAATPTPIYRIEGSTPNWSQYDQALPAGGFVVKAQGSMHGARFRSLREQAEFVAGVRQERPKSLVPDTKPFAPIVRLCSGDDCGTPIPLVWTGSEWSILVCEDLRRSYDQLEMWFNHYLEAPKELNRGSYQFRIEPSKACNGRD